MDTERIVIESTTACLLVGSFCQLIRFFYRSTQINYIVYLSLRLISCALIITAIYYLRRNRTTGELALLTFSSLIGLWIEN